MKKIILLFAAAAIFFASCTEKEDISASSIELSADSIAAGSEGKTFEIQVISSEDWRVSGKPVDWVTLSAEGGQSGETVSVTVEPNSTMETKIAEFKFFAGSSVKVLTVTSASSYAIEFNDGAQTKVLSSGGNLRISITTNIPEIEVEFSGDGASWVTYKGRSDVFGKTTLSFTVSPTEIYKERSTEITLSGEGASKVFTLTQAQLDAVISKEEDNRVQTDLAEQDVKFTVKHNVEFEDIVLPDWIELKGIETQPADEDGLQTSEFTLHLDAASATRLAALAFNYKGATLLQMIIRQQNPNPVLTDISDEGLRDELDGLGWIIAEPGNKSCEILESGLTATSLNLEYDSWYGGTDIKVVDGLGAFPALSSISLTGHFLDILDLSDCKGISEMSLNIYALSEVYLGDNPLDEFSIVDDPNAYLSNKSLSIAGNKLTSVNINATNSWYLEYYEELEELDVTGCPALTELHAMREYSAYNYDTWEYITVCNLKTIYVSAEQKAAIDAGTLTVEKSEQTVIVVK